MAKDNREDETKLKNRAKMQTVWNVMFLKKNGHTIYLLLTTNAPQQFMEDKIVFSL